MFSYLMDSLLLLEAWKYEQDPKRLPQVLLTEEGTAPQTEIEYVLCVIYRLSTHLLKNYMTILKQIVWKALTKWHFKKAH